MASNNRRIASNVPVGARLWVIGPLTVILAALANLAVFVLADAFIDVPSDFMPFNAGSVVALTVFGVGAGVLVYAALRRANPTPDRTFRRVALVALAASWVADVGLLVGGGPVDAVLVLAVMHAIAAAITVGLLTGLATRKAAA